MKKPTPCMLRLLQLMREGHTLMWHGSNGPELSDFPFWPQKRTVRPLLDAGLLAWAPHHNETQKQCGIRPIALTEKGKALTHESNPVRKNVGR